MTEARNMLATNICILVFRLSNAVINAVLFPLMLVGISARAIMLRNPSAIIPVFLEGIRKQRDIEDKEYEKLERHLTQNN